MNIKDKYLLQQYNDGTFGYYLIDGDEHCNYKNESKVVYMQGEDEDREEFIIKNSITFKPTQYGSNLNLDKLVNNKDYRVRSDIAKQGYGLDKLINDENKWVRVEVVGQKYGLDKLVNDENKWVRTAVAEQGYGLDKLINDKDSDVRRAVADQGYGLDKLLDDENYFVRKAATRYLNRKANDDFIIDLGNKLLDKGYKLTANYIEDIFTDKTCTKFKEFYEIELVSQVLARLLYKNIRVNEINCSGCGKFVKKYLSFILNF